MDRELSESLDDLSQIFQDAIDKNNPVLDEKTVLSTKLLLENIYKQFPQRYYLYSDPDGGINIDSNNCNEYDWISIGCYVNGNMAITGVIDKKFISKFYENILNEPDEYICNLLKHIGKEYNERTTD